MTTLIVMPPLNYCCEVSLQFDRYTGLYPQHILTIYCSFWRDLSILKRHHAFKFLHVVSLIFLSSFGFFFSFGSCFFLVSLVVSSFLLLGFVLLSGILAKPNTAGFPNTAELVAAWMRMLFSFVITCLLIASQHHDCVFLLRWKCNRNSGCRICMNVCPHFEWFILCLYMPPIVSWWSQWVVVAAHACYSWSRWRFDTLLVTLIKVMTALVVLLASNGCCGDLFLCNFIDMCIVILTAVELKTWLVLGVYLYSYRVVCPQI